MNTLLDIARAGNWGMVGTILGIVTFLFFVMASPFMAMVRFFRRRPVDNGPYKQGHGVPNPKQQQGRIRMAYAVAIATLGVILVIANMLVPQPVVDAHTVSTDVVWLTATANMPPTAYLPKLFGMGPGDCRSDGQEGEHYEGRGNSGDTHNYCFLGLGGFTTETPSVWNVTPKPRIPITLTTTTTVTMTPVTPTPSATPTMEIPTGTPPTITETSTTTPPPTIEATPSPELPTETPRPQLPGNPGNDKPVGGGEHCDQGMCENEGGEDGEHGNSNIDSGHGNHDH